MTAIEISHDSKLVLATNPLAKVMKGKAFARYAENRDNIQDRFRQESILARAAFLERDVNCLDLDELHHPDPAFGTHMFPAGVNCFKCETEIVEAPMVSLVVLRKNGEFLKDAFGVVERGNVRVVFMYGHFFPIFLCNDCRTADTVEKKVQGANGPHTFIIHMMKGAHPQSYRRASLEAKQRNAGHFALIAAKKEAAERSAANINAMLQAAPQEDEGEIEELSLADLIESPVEPEKKPRATRKRSSRKMAAAATA